MHLHIFILHIFITYVLKRTVILKKLAAELSALAWYEPVCERLISEVRNLRFYLVLLQFTILLRYKRDHLQGANCDVQT